MPMIKGRDEGAFAALERWPRNLLQVSRGTGQAPSRLDAVGVCRRGGTRVMSACQQLECTSNYKDRETL